MIEIVVEGIAIDETDRTLMLLCDPGKTFYLPIWIGPAEAMSIQMELENRQAPRPMTHDLMNNILREVGVQVDYVLITDYRDNVYHATLVFCTKHGLPDIDARPSDAVALALRQNAPIYVVEQVVEEAAVPSDNVHEDLDLDPTTNDDIERFMRLIDGVDLSGTPKK